ncbi:TetR/AcrR family transcriptional regulator [Gordonia sp. C13]|uniref:TetR/AcrR family transcriptional regulator n=1 Tax=Gordonia sp. C13 TaxID=2935078 RepID=UPI00200AC648|nr:TetR/AcrR family transcriptional regulator [Gordonia sp. C13]MCK8615077.1 TetR/AcrR family transcriptional regulator [Gordonia sp. C13]
MGRAQERGGGHLSADDWIELGYAILAEEGFKQIKIDTVCKRMGVTKGSFYWHFTDIAAYRAALVARWGEWSDEEHQNFAALAGLPPRDRLLGLIAQLTSPRHWMIERAMREWARSDPEAEASIRTSDRRAREAVRRCLLDHGLDPRIASVRANWIFAMGIGALHLSYSEEDRAAAGRHSAELVDLMLTPA